MAARRFLWIVAIIVGLVFAMALVWRLAADRLIQVTMTPTIGFSESVQAPAPDYALASSWLARPDLKGNPALWVPEGFAAAPMPAAVVFFVSPTAFLERGRWNAPLDDAATNERLATFARMQASVFNGVAAVWIPRTRQATLGAFLKEGPDADAALALAYADVERAFDAFLAANPGDTPIIIAGHSQGSRHILHLMRARGAAIRERLVAVYAVGWAVALPGDLEALRLPACASAGQAGCVVSWQSWAADGDLAKAAESYAKVKTVTGARIGTSRMLCTNPLTGGGGRAGSAANAGALFGEGVEAKRVGAECAENGLLLIAPAPDDIGGFVLPNGNYHAYDYSLFWANARADVEARLSAFGGAKPLPPE